MFCQLLICAEVNESLNCAIIRPAMWLPKKLVELFSHGTEIPGTPKLGQCSAHGPALNTGMPSAIDMHDMYTSARPFLCEDWCHPALLDPSA